VLQIIIAELNNCDQNIKLQPISSPVITIKRTFQLPLMKNRKKKNNLIGNWKISGNTFFAMQIYIADF
jgi:hypothetical protein